MGTATTSQMTLKERLQRADAVLAPGVYDSLTALIAERSGFEAVYLSGGAVAYTLLGRSDVGLTTAKETIEVLSGDASTKNDVPKWAAKVGHEFLGTLAGEGYDRLFITRRK